MVAKNSLNKETFERLKEKMDNGLFPQWVVTDPEIYELELDKIFDHTWQFLGHESEIKKAGDYVTRWLVKDSVLLIRNKSGEINAFLNSCTHRGTQLCTTDCGNKKTFTCPYHGWSFNTDGDLIGIVSGKNVYGQEMKKDEWGLRPIPKVGVYQGMIFGSLDYNAMPLEEYLGDMKFYLDIMLGRSDGGMEVRGGPQRWVAKANWKMTQENFAADPYHAQSTHRSTVEVGTTINDPHYASYGHHVALQHGHGLSVITSPKGRSGFKYQNMPKSMWPMFEKNLSPEQLDIFSKVSIFVGGVFPNLAFVSSLKGTGGDLYNYLNFRVWRPIGPDQIEIWCWFLIDKEAPEEYKEEAYRGYINSFGPSGTLEQDDTEVWARIVQVNEGRMLKDKELNYNNFSNYLLGLDVVEADEDFPGPGVAYSSCYTDYLCKNIHNYWFELISKDFINSEEDRR